MMVGMGWSQEGAVGTVRHIAGMNRGPASLEQDTQPHLQAQMPSPHWAVTCPGSLARISRTGHGQPSLLNVCPNLTQPNPTTHGTPESLFLCFSSPR